ncbi:CDP-glucose 4,6-dehydratase [Paenalkalicoccus suaedae]|uniref:CDP-glucose 4,6-dehydratase n=1 Tax=Paenalkalicoccus suaedae TaxID=2592382 RepID=A0A859FC65_9BACI|nr:CDP-glucose 4,6-dehydratase [Paenalkalicoccus suaedae]QKS70362.1 CDP-glucose 4,6-dehydratase [Paenalkalicoccus suaedae]
MISTEFWKGKRVFLTGHTGFKGAWMMSWLEQLGAHVTGYSLEAETPSLYQLLATSFKGDSIIGDIRDTKKLTDALTAAKPDIVIHMAAQAFVGESYDEPLRTFDVNVIGTASVFDATLHALANGAPIRAVVNITTDKCYENKQWVFDYRENDRLGGKDPYSASKACAELLTTSYRNSFFTNTQAGLASVRAGNVIGGGDFADSRLIPQLLHAYDQKRELTLRNPSAIRPWQHVLDPLHGYLMLAQKLYQHPDQFAEGFNFGPERVDCVPVNELVDKLSHALGQPVPTRSVAASYHEEQLLTLNCTKAKTVLGWQPVWGINQTVAKIAEWHQNTTLSTSDIVHKQIHSFMQDASR